MLAGTPSLSVPLDTVSEARGQLPVNTSNPIWTEEYGTRSRMHAELEWLEDEGEYQGQYHGFFSYFQSHRRKLQQYLPAPTEKDQQEAKLVVEGGCVIDLKGVVNRACALITETVPFYYIDVKTQSMQVNESMISTNVRWVCWGSTIWTDPFPDIDRNAFLALAVGQGFKGMITACGIDRSGKLLCYGNNDPTISQEGLQVVGQAEPPEGRYRQVTVGGLHACATVDDDITYEQVGASLTCWGNNRMRQSTVPKVEQISVLYRIDYAFVSAGYEHTCAIRTDQRLVCWGSNFDGQIRVWDSELATEEKDGGYLSRRAAYGCCHDCQHCDCSTTTYAGVGARCEEIKRVSTGWYHTCVIRAGCDVQCINNNAFCRAGTVPQWYAPGSDCTCTSCSRPHELECWGYNAYGNSEVPAGQFKQVMASFDFTCAVYAECNGRDVVDAIVPGRQESQCALANTVICFGRNNKGQVSPPNDICDGADRARLEAEARFNNTVFATPPPPTPRPPCVCTPSGCDCLGQMPRLQFQAGGRVRGHVWVATLLAVAVVVTSRLSYDEW